MYNLRVLIKYEYKKLLQRKTVWIVTLALMAMAAASVILPPFMSAVSSDRGDSYTAYDSYKAQRKLAADLKGRPLDDELLKEMNDAYAAERESAERITAFPDSAVPYSVKYDDIYTFIVDVYESGIRYGAYESGNPYISADEDGIPYFTGTAAQLYNIGRTDLEKRWEQEYLTEEEISFLSTKEDALTTPFIYQYCGSYKSMLALFPLLAVMISFLTAVCIPPVSAEEHSRKTDQIVLCTRFGRRPAFLAKLFTAVTFSVGVVFLLFLSTAVSSFAIYGTEGFNAQIQFSAFECTWDFTVGQGVLLLFGISIAAAVMLSCTGLFLAECFRSSIPAMGILIGFLLISSVLNIPGQFRVLSQIWSYCPAKLISITGSLMDHRLVPFFGTYLASYQTRPFIYLILALLFAFGGYFVWRRWQADGR